VAACSERFQDLSHSELHETLVGGFLQREDFEIAECAPQSEATSVFKLLEDACLGFAKRSSFSQRKKLKTPIYSTMLWSKLQCSDFPTISVQSVTSNLLFFGVYCSPLVT